MRISLLGIMSILFLAFGSLQAEYNAYQVSTVPAEKQASGYREIRTEELNRLLQANPSMTIVDARLPKHDNGHRIPGAKFLPYDSFDVTIESALPDKEAPIVVYCASIRCPVSKYMAERLVSLNYQNVIRYPDGLEGWEKHGYHIERVAPTQTKDIAETNIQKN